MAVGRSLDVLRESLRSLRHLHLDLGSTSKPLDLLLSVIPNATSIRLYSTARDIDIGEVVSALSSTQMLTELDCDFIDVRSRPDDNFRSLVQMYSGTLQLLRLDCAAMTHEGFMAIGECTKLRYLDLMDAHRFKNCHLENIVENLPDLEILRVGWCSELPSAGLKRIQDLRKLRSLHFAGDIISNDAFTGLGEIPTLRDLCLIGDRINIGILQNIVGLKDLRSLELNVAVESEGFSTICENFPMLEELSLLDSRQLSDCDGVKLCLFEHLRCVTFVPCPGFTDLTFRRGLVSPALEEIEVSECNVTDVGLASLAAHHGRLKRLSFHECAKITDTGLARLVERQPYLRYLDVFDCAALSDRLLSVLEPICPRLRELVISDELLVADRETAERFSRTNQCKIH